MINAAMQLCEGYRYLVPILKILSEKKKYLEIGHNEWWKKLREFDPSLLLPSQ